MSRAERSATRQAGQPAEPAQSRPSPERIYHGFVRALSLLFVVLGVTILAVTLAAGGSVLSIGVLMGIGFVAIGAGRLWTASRTGR